MTSAASPPLTSTHSMQNGRKDRRSAGLPAWIEILIVAVVYCGVTVIPGNPLPGPIAIAVCSMIVWGLLRLRGESWKTLGLNWPRSIGGFLKAAGFTFAVLLVVFLVGGLMPFVTQRIFGVAAAPEYPDVSTLGRLFTLLAIAWSTAAIGEELLFRGFLMTRLSQTIGLGRIGWGIALIAHAVIFGMLHAYQGLSGILLTGSIGLVFGIFYLLGRRNILPLIFAHGIVNTISFVALHIQTSAV